MKHHTSAQVICLQSLQRQSKIFKVEASPNAIRQESRTVRAGQCREAEVRILALAEPRTLKSSYIRTMGRLVELRCRKSVAHFCGIALAWASQIVVAQPSTMVERAPFIIARDQQFAITTAGIVLTPVGGAALLFQWSGFVVCGQDSVAGVLFSSPPAEPREVGRHTQSFHRGENRAQPEKRDFMRSQRILFQPCTRSESRCSDNIPRGFPQQCSAKLL